MLDFLKVNQLIDIEVEPGTGYGGRYRTRVEDINNKGIVIGMPMEQGKLVPLRPNTTVIIWHCNNTASFAYYCKVKERIFEPVPLVFLEWPYETKKVQRRNYVRVPTNLKIEYFIDEKGKGNSKNEGVLRDLSGGGAQFITNAKLLKGNLLKIKLYLPDITLDCKAKIVWVKEERVNNYLRYLIGITFIDIEERIREKIIKYVFKRQRELISKGVL